MTEIKHTPLPWVHGELYTIENQTGDKIARLYRCDETTIANLRFIVNACNSHYDLVAIVENALVYLSETNHPVDEAVCAYWKKRLEEAKVGA